jgi:hypothetical protein
MGVERLGYHFSLNAPPEWSIQLNALMIARDDSPALRAQVIVSRSMVQVVGLIINRGPAIRSAGPRRLQIHKLGQFLKRTAYLLKQAFVDHWKAGTLRYGQAVGDCLQSSPSLPVGGQVRIGHAQII